MAGNKFISPQMIMPSSAIDRIDGRGVDAKERGEVELL
jgi:hypothetical protein